MKKLIMTAAVACAASIVSAQVYSQNIVGYTKVDCVGGQLTLAAFNWSGSNTLSQIVGDQLPGGSSINIWDKNANTYITCTKLRSGWSPDETVYTGDALWLSSSAAAGVTNEVVFSGNVLMDATNTVTLNGLDATGYYYPVAVDWTNTDLSVQAPGGSSLNVWNGSGYDTYTKLRAGWSGSPTIQPGQAFWITVPSAITWSETRPFTP